MPPQSGERERGIILLNSTIILSLFLVLIVPCICNHSFPLLIAPWFLPCSVVLASFLSYSHLVDFQIFSRVDFGRLGFSCPFLWLSCKSMGKKKKTSRQPSKLTEAATPGSSNSSQADDGQLRTEQGFAVGLDCGEQELSVNTVTTITPKVVRRGNDSDSAERGGKGKSTIAVYEGADKVLDKRPAFRYLNLDDVSSWWGFFLFGYFPHRFVGETKLIKMCSTWKVKYHYHPHSSGILVFGFENEQDMLSVLSKGPVYMYGKVLALRALPRSFEFGYNGVNLMPLWINLPSLPLECWTEEALSEISSEVGKYIFTDNGTQPRGKKSYARVLVEVDVAKELVRCVPFKLGNGVTWMQDVVYEFETKFCSSCEMFGHLSFACQVDNLVDKVASVGVQERLMEHNGI